MRLFLLVELRWTLSFKSLLIWCNIISREGKVLFETTGVNKSHGSLISLTEFFRKSFSRKYPIKKPHQSGE